MGVNVWRGIFIRSPSVGRTKNRSLDFRVVSCRCTFNGALWVFALSGRSVSDWAGSNFRMGEGGST